MGLDITAYRNLSKIDAIFESDDDWEPLNPITRKPLEEDYVIACVEKHAVDKASPLVHRGVYRSGESHEFRAGSYGWYNKWRNELAQLAGYPGRKTESGEISYCLECWGGAPGPFSELINFSDCEGTIGPACSAKLAGDFAAFDGNAKELDENFYEAYQEWRKAFEMAAENGAVFLS